MKGRTTIKKTGEVIVELTEHSSDTDISAEWLRKLLERPDLLSDVPAALSAIRQLVLHAKTVNADANVDDALTILVEVADIAGLLAVANGIGAAKRNDYVRLLYAAREALSGRAHTAAQGFRVPEGEWTMLVCDLLDESRDAIEREPNSKEDLVRQVQSRIVTIAGRMPDQTLVLDALGVARADGAKCPRLIEAYYALLQSIGCEPKSEDALKRARTRHKAIR